MEQDIVSAAARIFHEKGYAATSIRDIADAVGLLKGSLYYYVRSKEDLLYKIIMTVQDGAKRNMDRAANTDGSAVDRVRALVHGHLGHLDPGLAMVRVFYVDIHHLSAGRQARILEERDGYEHFLRDLIAAGQHEGAFVPDLDPHLAAIAILTMMDALYLRYGPGRSRAISQVAREYERLIMRGLSKGPDDDSDIGADRGGGMPGLGQPGGDANWVMSK
jgi:AcrR family transcriptional regulator